MLSRREINKRYYESNKDELKQKRKERTLNQKKQALTEEWKNIDFDEKNVYLNRMGELEMDEYCRKRKRKFDLQYDIDHMDKREKGDKHKYSKEKKDAYRDYCIEVDRKHRIEKYRLFRNSYVKKFGKEPNLTAMVINENIIPEEVNPKSELYNENLLPLLEEQEGDKIVEVKQLSDLVSSDEE